MIRIKMNKKSNRYGIRKSFLKHLKHTRLKVRQKDVKNIRKRLRFLMKEEETDYEVVMKEGYPLIRKLNERMMELRLTAKSEGEAVFDLLRFIQKQIDKFGAKMGVRRIFECWFSDHTTNGHQFITMSNRHQELASPEANRRFCEPGDSPEALLIQSKRLLEHSEAEPILDFKALDSQNKYLNAKVNALHDLNEHFRIKGKTKCITIPDPVKPKVLAPAPPTDPPKALDGSRRWRISGLHVLFPWDRFEF
ncbi:hypothetical protein Tco_0930684 [Tanacetum coccineum]